MKKLLLLFALVTMSYGLYAQELGVRFGDGYNNVAVDGVFTLGQFSRVHADVNFGNGVGIEALWDFLYRPVADVDGLDWYVGVGPSMWIDDPFFLGAAGEIGMEYHFDFPLAIGVDWRPIFWIIEDTDFRADSFGLNIRYVFGNVDR
ncbi:outer membrane insertion C- signal [Echinicola salinicaeni]|uniref:outer membrane insertion C- signal n=1 Tax=Echinicola salinicaeni TaxID=2762757 RepID=UPI001646F2BB|nr:outer membrane insertion C- signal [Echinicola salinicaeni]